MSGRISEVKAAETSARLELHELRSAVGQITTGGVLPPDDAASSSSRSANSPGCRSSGRASLPRSSSAAAEAGARWVVLCDTNGGTLPHEVSEIVAAVTRGFIFGQLASHATYWSGLLAARAGRVVSALTTTAKL